MKVVFPEKGKLEPESVPTREAIELVKAGEAIISTDPDLKRETYDPPPRGVQVEALTRFRIYDFERQRLHTFIEGDSIPMDSLWIVACSSAVKAQMAHPVLVPLGPRSLLVRTKSGAHLGFFRAVGVGSVVAIGDVAETRELSGEIIWPPEDPETAEWLQHQSRDISRYVRVVVQIAKDNDPNGWRPGDRLEMSWDTYRREYYGRIVLSAGLMKGHSEAPETPKRMPGRSAYASCRAISWLWLTLLNGPEEVATLREKAARKDISEITLRRAREALEVQTLRKGQPPNQQALWALPGDGSLIAPHIYAIANDWYGGIMGSLTKDS